MTIRSDRRYPVVLKVPHVAVRPFPTAVGAVRLADADLVVDRTAMRLEGRSLRGSYRRRIPYSLIAESMAHGQTGLFLRLLSGEGIYLDVEGRDEWLKMTNQSPRNAG